MSDDKIVSYIEQARDAGLIETEIRQNLLNVGWGSDVIDASFKTVNEKRFPIRPQLIPKPNYTGNQESSAYSGNSSTITMQKDISAISAAAASRSPIDSKPKISHLAKVGFGIIILFVLLAGSGFAGWTYYNNLPKSSFVLNFHF